MAININHTNNTLSSNSGTFIFGDGIVPSIENAVYSSNFSGKYYGDGSALTGLAAGGASNPNDFVNLENNYSFVLGNNNSNSGCYNFIQGNNNVTSGCFGVLFGGNNTTFEGANTNVILSSSAVISGGACNNVILGGILNKICSNTYHSVILGGVGTVASASSTAYGVNFCSYGGKYYGDASELTGLATGSFLTTGQYGLANEDRNLIVGGGVYSGCYNVALNNGEQTYTAAANTCSNTIINSNNTSIEQNAKINFIVGSNNSTISGGSCGNSILGGSSHSIKENNYFSVILGGSQIQACSSNTAYANNFCAYGGKYYGDASELTGLATGNFIVSSKCQVVAKNNTPFNICAVTRVASTYLGNALIESQAGVGVAYLCDHDDASTDDCNLYTINSNGYCTAQFSAMILGNAVYGNDIFTTSMTINGVAGSGSVLSQNKIINSKAFPTDDACVVVEDGYLRIYITGTQTGMNWGTRLDILGMVGYD